MGTTSDPLALARQRLEAAYRRRLEALEALARAHHHAAAARVALTPLVDRASYLEALEHTTRPLTVAETLLGGVEAVGGRSAGAVHHRGTRFAEANQRKA